MGGSPLTAALVVHGPAGTRVPQEHRAVAPSCCLPEQAHDSLLRPRTGQGSTTGGGNARQSHNSDMRIPCAPAKAWRTGCLKHTPVSNQSPKQGPNVICTAAPSPPMLAPHGSSTDATLRLHHSHAQSAAPEQPAPHLWVVLVVQQVHQCYEVCVHLYLRQCTRHGCFGRR